MVIYLIVFFIALLVIKISEFVHVKVLSFVILLFGISIPSLLAGMRSIYVGTDILYYGLNAFKLSMVTDLNYVLSNYSKIGDNSVIFYSLWYISSKIFRELSGPQFILEFLIELNIIVGLLKNKAKHENYHIWYGMAVYYFVFYSYSLNLMKQSLAMSMIFLCYQYLLNDNRIVAYIVSVIIIGTFCHTSAYIGLVAVILRYFYTKFYAKKFAISLVKIMAFLIPIFLIFLYGPLMTIVLKFLPRYSLYLTNAYSNISSIRGLVTQVVLLFIVYLSFIFTRYTVELRSKDIELYEIAYLLGVGLFNFSMVARNGYRIGLYFLYIGGISILPEILRCEKRVDGESESIFVSIFRAIIILICLFLFWYISFVQMKINQVVPYSFG